MTEDKLILILIFVGAIIGILLLWNNISYERIIKRLKKSEQQSPDEKYFELKYKIQYLVFAGLLLVAFLGALGFDSFKTVEKSMQSDLDKKANIQTERVDSLINVRIDQTNEEINRVYNSMVQNLENASSQLENAREEVDDYNNQMRRLNSKIGYNRLNVIDQFKVSDYRSKILVIPYSNFGFEKFDNVPTVFVNPNGDFDIKTVDINNESFSIKIENAIADTVSMNILFFVK